MSLPQNDPFQPAIGSLYIDIDGGEGTGKTTFISYFARLINERQPVLMLKEPGFTKVGQIIRDKVLGSEQPLDDQRQLFLADRIVTQQTVIKPALMQGKVVISDRAWMSSLVYQGLMACDIDRVIELHQSVPDLIYPELTIIATCPIDVALARVAARTNSGAETNYLDTAQRQFHEQIHGHFLNAAEWFPHPFVHVDFNRPVEEIAKDVINKIQEYVGILL